MSTTKVVDRGTLDTNAEVVEVLDQASMAGEAEVGARASRASHRIRSSSAPVPPHRSPLQGAAACAVDNLALPAVVASSQGSEDTSFRDELDVEEAPHSPEP